MKITDVEALVLRTGEIDASRADGTQDAFVVRIHTDEGVVGVGEGDTSPYVARTIVNTPSSHSLSRGLRDVILGEDPLRVRPLWDEMFLASYHYGRDGAALHAMSAIDMALWDLAGKVEGRSVADLLGGAVANEVEVYASEVMPETPEEVTAVAARVVGEGFGALKLGWGPLGRDVGRDVELATAARDALGPNRKLMIDGGMAYTVASAQEFCRRSESLHLFWFEEPFLADDLDAYERLTRSVGIRIACGEAHSTAAPFRQLIAAGVSILQPDLGRCGGPTIAPRHRRPLPRRRRERRRDPALLLDRRAPRRDVAVRRDAARRAAHRVPGDGVQAVGHAAHDAVHTDRGDAAPAGRSGSWHRRSTTRRSIVDWSRTRAVTCVNRLEIARGGGRGVDLD